MTTIPIWKFDDPMEVLWYINNHWGNYGARWDLKHLVDLHLTNEEDLTFLLLKFKLREQLYDQ